MGLELKNRYLRLTVYSYLDATELLQKITVLSKFERNLVKTSKLYEFRGEVKIIYLSKKKFPLAIFLYASRLSFKLCSGKNTSTTQTMEILKRMPIKFKNFGANIELIGYPDSDLMNVVLDNNIRFDSIKITSINLQQNFSDQLRKFMKQAKTLILDGIKLKYNFVESDLKEPNNIENLQIRQCQITGASELIGDKLSDLEIQGSTVDNGIFDHSDNYIKSITLKDVDLTNGEYRYTRFVRMLKSQRILKKVHITSGYMHNSQIQEICDSIKNRRNIECSIHLNRDKRTFQQVLFQMDFLIKYPFLDYKVRHIEYPALIKAFPFEGDNNLLSRTYLDREDYREIQKYYFKIYKENDVLVFIKRDKKQFKIGCLDQLVVTKKS